MPRTPKKVIVDIQVITENGNKHYVRLTSDGHELKRWGPYAVRDDAVRWAARAAQIASQR